MGSLKKFAGSSWVNSNLRKLTTDTDTFTTLPAIIYAEGTNATVVGLKGNTVQSGTPTPDSPIMPQGTGERTGNLFDYKSVYASYIDNNGNISTTANNLTSWNYFTEDDIGKTFTVSLYVGSISNSYIRVQGQIDSNYITGNAINAGSTGYTEITVTPTSTSDRWRITYGTETPDVVLNQVMVAVSATRKEYEPYGYKIPISSANTTTPVYLGEVPTTRKIRRLVLDGTENITSGHLDVSLFNIPISDYLKQSTITVIATHYIAQSNVNGWEDVNDKSITFYGNTGSATKAMYIRDSSYSTVADFKAYLAQQYAAGTPVTVWYVLAEPETAVVNEPLMRIGDYADTLSNVSIPVTAGGDTISIGTTVQPSEVTANYYGWHTITVHERESSQWD